MARECDRSGMSGAVISWNSVCTFFLLRSNRRLASRVVPTDVVHPTMTFCCVSFFCSLRKPARKRPPRRRQNAPPVVWQTFGAPTSPVDNVTVDTVPPLLALAAKPAVDAMPPPLAVSTTPSLLTFVLTLLRGTFSPMRLSFSHAPALAVGNSPTPV